MSCVFEIVVINLRICTTFIKIPFFLKSYVQSATNVGHIAVLMVLIQLSQ